MKILENIKKNAFPHLQVTASRFYQSCFLLLLLLAPPSPSAPCSTSPSAYPSPSRPPVSQPQAADSSGHCQTIACARSQWALPGLSRERQISVGAAGHQRQAPDSGHCRTSTASARSQWALPDLSQTPERMSQKECQNRYQLECQKEF